MAANAFLPLTATIAIAVALALTGYRLLRGERFSAAIGGLLVVAAAVDIVALTGSAKNFFVLGIWVALAGFVVTFGSVLARRPLAKKLPPARHRRRRLAVGAATTVLFALTACSAPVPATPTDGPLPGTTAGPADRVATAEAFAELEQRFDVRLGVFAVDTGSERTVAYRADDRFAYASTYKALAAAAVLDRTSGPELDLPVSHTADDLVPNSPVTEERLRTGLTLGEAAEAAVRRSDNTAGNLLLEALDGPAGFDADLAAMGDDVTRADRTETALNDTAPGDVRDTSTPQALATTLRAYAVDDALAPKDRSLLLDWMTGNATGDTLVRAGVPSDWTVVDKSGAAGYGTRNDIAVVQPPSAAPIVIAVLSTRHEPDAEYDDAVVAAAARLVVDALTA